MANTTWNAADKSANVALTGSNLIATASGATGWVRAVDRQVTGKFYWECRPTVWGNANTAVGLCPGAALLAAPNGGTGAGMGVVYKSGAVWINAINSGSSLGARAANDVIGIAIDLAAQLVWFRVSPVGNWNGSGTADPATGAGGVPIPIVGIEIPAFPLAVMGANLDAVTANFGDSAFSGTVPVGFTSGFTAGASITPPTSTSWNPFDETAGITLSNGNRTAVAGALNQGVRGIAGFTTGKYYFETTMTTFGFGTGVALSSQSFSTGTANAAVTFNNGQISIASSIQGVGLGARANGDIIGIAVDIGNLIWFRVAPSGNWNGSGTANPATGSGGYSVSGLSGALFPILEQGSSGATATANFGASGFSGAVPVGFTAGFGTGLPSGGGATQARAMVLA